MGSNFSEEKDIFEGKYPENASESILELKNKLEIKEQRIKALESHIRDRDERIETLIEDLHNFIKQQNILLRRSNKGEKLNKVQNQKTLQRLRKVHNQYRLKNKCKKYLNSSIFFLALAIIAPSVYFVYLQSTKIIYFSFILALVGFLFNILPIPSRGILWETLVRYLFKKIRNDEIGMIMNYDTNTEILKDGTAHKNEYIEIVNIGYYAEELSGWAVKILSDNERYMFPNKTQLEPGKSIRLYLGFGPDEFNGTSFHWKREKLLWPESGDTIILQDKNEVVVDEIELEAYHP